MGEDKFAATEIGLHASLSLVLWQHYSVEDATWELKSNMHELYPHLFADGGTFKFQEQNFLL